MKIPTPCDVCGVEDAVVYCSSDDASLCIKCDESVHSANPLASRHRRTNIATGALQSLGDLQADKAYMIDDLALPIPSEDGCLPDGDRVDADDTGSASRGLSDSHRASSTVTVPKGLRTKKHNCGAHARKLRDMASMHSPNTQSQTSWDNNSASGSMDSDTVGFELMSRQTSHLSATSGGMLSLDFDDVISSWSSNATDSWGFPAASDIHGTFLPALGFPLNPLEDSNAGSAPLDNCSPSTTPSATTSPPAPPRLTVRGDGELELTREERVARYKEKKRNRAFSKKIRYQVRKLNAERRPRIKGRFVKKEELAGLIAQGLLDAPLYKVKEEETSPASPDSTLEVLEPLSA